MLSLHRMGSSHERVSTTVNERSGHSNHDIKLFRHVRRSRHGASVPGKHSPLLRSAVKKLGAGEDGNVPSKFLVAVAVGVGVRFIYTLFWGRWVERSTVS